MASSPHDLLALLERAAAELKATQAELDAERKAHARTKAELAVLPVGNQDVTKPGLAALYNDDEVTASGLLQGGVPSDGVAKAADTARMRPLRRTSSETVEGQDLHHLARIGELEEALATVQGQARALTDQVAALTHERDELSAKVAALGAHQTPAPTPAPDGRVAELEALLQKEFEKTQGLATKLAEARARLKTLETPQADGTP